MKEAAQGQMTFESVAADSSESTGMITDIYSPPTRKLMQPGDISGAIIDSETAAALAFAIAAKTPKLPTKTAKLLVENSKAVAIECATIAFPSVGSPINTTVAVDLMSSSSSITTNATANSTTAGSSRLSLTFPYFETLYYDPVISFGSTEGMQVNDVAPAGNCTGIVCGRTAERHTNSAVTASSGLVHGAAAVLVALLLMVWI